MHDRPGNRARRLTGALLALGLALTGCVEVGLSEAGAPVRQSTASAAPVAGSALAALEQIDVKGRAPRTGYERDRFGSGWADTDRNGCDTRNDVLARDLTGEAFVPGTRDCVVLSGTLADPYSGRVIEFVRGEGTSEAVQIDHVVALSDAWQKGAQGWDDDQRVRFANDPLNLLAADGPLNMQKGDADAATWLPPDDGFRCAYVARQVAVKVTYGLWATRAERDAMAGVLGGCPDEPLPGGGGAPATTTSEESGAPVYPDCAAVRAEGAAPIHRGDPGWSEQFDGDGDGVGCEG